MNALTKVLSIFAVSLLQLLSTNVHTSDPAPCLPPSDLRANMLADYQFTDTTSDAYNVRWREALMLPVVPVSEIVAVEDTVLCRRAVTAYNYILAVDSVPATTAVNLIKYGSTRFIIGDPSHTAGEYRLEAIVDSSFAELITTGR